MILRYVTERYQILLKPTNTLNNLRKSKIMSLLSWFENLPKESLQIFQLQL